MTKQFYENDSLPFEFEGVSYTINVRAHGTYYYSPATRYEPEDSEFEIDDVEATWKNENGEVVEETEEMSDALWNYLSDSVDWEDCDPPEPDYDYYEEREMERWEAELDRYDL